MDAPEVFCNRAGADGMPCGEPMAVLSGQFIYRLSDVDFEGSPVHTLHETRYELHCRLCHGWTYLVERTE